jgi:hypothetical protein
MCGRSGMTKDIQGGSISKTCRFSYALHRQPFPDTGKGGPARIGCRIAVTRRIKSL